MKPVMITLVSAAFLGLPIVMGCSSDPGPSEPQTVVAGQRPPSNGGGGDEVAQGVDPPGDSHALNAPAQPNPTPSPWNPGEGPSGNGPVPTPATPDGPTPAQPTVAGDGEPPAPVNHHHVYNEAVRETLKGPHNQF